MTLFAVEESWLIACCGSRFAFLSRQRCNDHVNDPNFHLVFQGETNNRLFHVAQSDTQEDIEGELRKICVSKGNLSSTRENITCCALSVEYNVALFGTDRKRVWIFELIKCDEKASQVVLISIVDTEKRPVSLCIISSNTFLLGEKAGFISKVELKSRKDDSESVESILGVPCLTRKRDDSHVKNNVFVSAREVSYSTVAGCVSSLLVQIAVQPKLKSLVALCDRDMKIKLFNYPNMHLIEGILMGHRDYVTCCCFLGQDYSLLLSGSHDGTIRLWDISSDICVKSISVVSLLHEKWENVNLHPILALELSSRDALICTREPAVLIWVRIDQSLSDLNVALMAQLHLKGVQVTCMQSLIYGQIDSGRVLIACRNHQSSEGGLQRAEDLSHFCLISIDFRNCKLQSSPFNLFDSAQMTGAFFLDENVKLDFETVTPNAYVERLDGTGSYFGLSPSLAQSPSDKLEGSEFSPGPIKKPKLSSDETLQSGITVP